LNRQTGSVIKGKIEWRRYQFSGWPGLFLGNKILASGGYAAVDYKAIDLLPKSARNRICNGSVITIYPFWRFGTYHIIWFISILLSLPRL
jgi:hypothetical protein